VPDGTLIDVMPKVGQGTLDTAVAPGRILLGHAHRQQFNLGGHRRSSRLRARWRVITLLGHKAAIPALEGLRSGDRGDFLKVFSVDWVRQDGKAAALGISEVKTTALEFGFQEAIFLAEIGDGLFLLPIDPHGKHGDQNLQDHGPS
jgi:hypothetical protein